jgi:superfamily II DNA/RNA helicase
MMIKVSNLYRWLCNFRPLLSTSAIGRTGRAEASGNAFTLMIAEDANHVFAIERFINQKIARGKLENFDYRYAALFEQDKPGAKSGRTGSARAMRVHGGYHFRTRSAKEVG